MNVLVDSFDSCSGSRLHLKRGLHLFSGRVFVITGRGYVVIV